MTFDSLDGPVSWHFKKWVGILREGGTENLAREYHRMMHAKHDSSNTLTVKFKTLSFNSVNPKNFSWSQINKDLADARQLATSNHFKDAKEKITDVLQLAPSHCFALLELGRIAWAEKDFNSTEWYFNQALQVNPFNIDTLKALGSLQLVSGHIPKAIEYFEQGLQIDNKDPELWRWLGKCYMESNDFDKARHACERSINYAIA
jgi:tetratricopeptide (TPR) repeat protein